MTWNAVKSDRLVFLSEADIDPFPRFGDAPRIIRDKNVLRSGNSEILLPGDRLYLEELITAGRLDLWEPMVDWLTEHVGLDRILMIPPDDPYRELGLLGLARKRFSYGLAFHQAPQRMSARDYAVYGSAKLFLFADQAIEDGLRRAYVPYYNGVQSGDGPAKALKAAAEFETANTAQDWSPEGSKISSGPRILLIAYFSGPARTVGAHRVNYWHSQIPVLWPGASVTLATATPWDQPASDVVIIPDLGGGNLIDVDGSVPKWAVPFLESEKLNAKNFNTLSQSWRIALEKYFETRDDHFDVVILSGNPFAVFDFSAYAKRRWSARVVLDYRDPFANNPRMAYKPEARKWARYIEKGYNLQADLVTVVNDDCANMVEGREDVPVVVVRNGFDDRNLPQARSRWSRYDKRFHFVHAGTIYPGRSPEALINALAKYDHHFHHIGNASSIPEEYRKDANVELYGTRPNIEALELISQADCGVIFVHDNGFDTPTKLFDYMAYDLDILILTGGLLGVGAAGKIFKDIQRVYWAQNTPDGIEAFLKGYKPSPARRPANVIESFSRRAGTESFLKEISALIDLSPSGWREATEGLVAVQTGSAVNK